jgi:hypothetical protein
MSRQGDRLRLLSRWRWCCISHFGSHTGDPNFDFYPYHWAKEYAQRFAEGWLYPRWTFFARYGLGEPIFVFYSPLYYLLTALLTLTGLGTWKPCTWWRC